LASRIETLAHVAIPGSVRRVLKSPIRAFERRLLGGDRITCPVCDGHFRRLMSRHGHPNRQCPSCHSLVRHRAMWLFLRDRLGIQERRLRVLHFAPERGIAARIRATGADHVTGDIDAALASERIDITAIPYPEASFDLVICSHVLEHVPDDRTAIAEIRRVLRPGGQALIVVPIKLERTEEFRDPAPTPAHPDGYLRRGPHGHVRKIGADYPDRLRDAGLRVEVIDYADELSADERARYAIEPGEIFYLCTRPAIPSEAAPLSPEADAASTVATTAQ
jgi:SAM-dependent methyltransferase